MNQIYEMRETDRWKTISFIDQKVTHLWLAEFLNQSIRESEARWAKSASVCQHLMTRWVEQARQLSQPLYQVVSNQHSRVLN